MAFNPVNVKNTFLRHFVFWVFFLPTLTIILLPLFIDNPRIDDQEVRMLQTLNVDVDKLTTSTNTLFTHWFVNSGLYEGSIKFFTGNALKTSFIFNWINGVWSMVYKTIWRYEALYKLLVLPLIFLCIPSAIDGVMVRSRKKYNFERSNQIFFYSASHLFTLTLGLLVFLPMIPFTLSSYIIALALLTLVISIWISASNFQTGF